MPKTQRFISKFAGPYSERDESSSYPNTLFLYDLSQHYHLTYTYHPLLHKYCSFFSSGFPIKIVNAFLIWPCLWVPVTTAWRVLRLLMEERPPIWSVAVNKLNKQSRTADNRWSSSFGVGRGSNNSSPWKKNCYEILMGEMLPLETKQSGGRVG